MDSVIEKITLYDILVYLLPGSLIILSLIHVYFLKSNIGIEKVLADYSGLLVYAFIVLSFLCGVLLSEVGYWAFAILDKIVKRVKGKENGRIQDGNKNRNSDKWPVSDELIKKALVKGHILSEENEFDDNKKQEYLGSMYSDIQTDKTFNRIHNYVSAKFMYKNLILAIIVSVMIYGERFTGEYNHAIIFVATASIIMLSVRYRRFVGKTNYYTVLWYAEKYLNGHIP